MRRPPNSTVAELLGDHVKLLANELNQHTETVPIESKTYCLDDLRMQEDVRKLLENVMTELRLKLNGRYCSRMEFVRVPNAADECKFVAYTPKFTE